MIRISNEIPEKARRLACHEADQTKPSRRTVNRRTVQHGRQLGGEASPKGDHGEEYEKYRRKGERNRNEYGRRRGGCGEELRGVAG